MPLSKKHYKAIAQIINNFHVFPKTLESIDDIVADLATYFKRDNPDFDKQKFYDACYKEAQK